MSNRWNKYATFNVRFQLIKYRFMMEEGTMDIKKNILAPFSFLKRFGSSSTDFKYIRHYMLYYT